MTRNLLKNKKITVIGAGLGGLCAALAFARRGAAVHVFENANELAEVGAGIQVSANGLRVLKALGIDASLCGYASKGLTLNDHHGRRVAILPNQNREVRLFHRADLLELLSNACSGAGVRVSLGQHITPQNLPEADLIVAADGVNSEFRALVQPTAAQPHFSGQVAWRALVAVPEPIHEGGVNVYMGPGRHVVLYPLRGGSVLNIVAVEDTKSIASEGWTQSVVSSELRDRFSDFGGPLPALFERVTSVNRWGLYHHPVPRPWSEGNTVLLGDAAHPMLPFLAQGASMAFEDAWVLVSCLDADADLDTALGGYERLRAPRVARVMKEARANATRFHHSNPVTRFLGHNALKGVSRFAPDLMARRFDWIYGADVTV